MSETWTLSLLLSPGLLNWSDQRMMWTGEKSPRGTSCLLKNLWSASQLGPKCGNICQNYTSKKYSYLTHGVTFIDIHTFIPYMWFISLSNSNFITPLVFSEPLCFDIYYWFYLHFKCNPNIYTPKKPLQLISQHLSLFCITHGTYRANTAFNHLHLNNL